MVIDEMPEARGKSQEARGFLVHMLRMGMRIRTRVANPVSRDVLILDSPPAPSLKIREGCAEIPSRSHALRGNAYSDALRP